MLDVNCKCIFCNKTWVDKIDEHDYNRYIDTPKLEDTDSLCGCGGHKPINYQPINLNVVCDDCNEYQ